MQKIIHTIKLSPAVIIPSTLLFLTLTSALVLLSSNSNADTTSATASVTVPDTCYMSSTSTTHTDTLNGGTYTENFGGESTVTVTCNDRNGYSVYAVGYSNDTEGTTNLIGTSTGLVIPSGTSTSTSVSNWAMKLTPVAGTYAPTILSDANGSYSNYHIVPSTATKVATYTSDINVANSSQFKTSYAVAVAPSQAADTYIGKVKYTVVHPNYANSDGTIPTYTVTLGFNNASSIIIDGIAYSPSTSSVTLAHGTHTVSGTFPTNYEISYWDSTSNIVVTDLSSDSTTINITGTGTLTLNGLLNYCTQKGIADSNCMQKMTPTQCQKNVSNNIGDNITVYDARDGKDYTVRYINGECWMTQNLRFTGTSVSPVTSNIAIDKTLTYYDLATNGASGEECYGSNGYNNACIKDSGSTSTGVWYNYNAATAGTVSDSSNSVTASQDICPKNWHLPTGPNTTPNTDLNIIVGNTTSGWQDSTTNLAAFSAVTGGFYDNKSLRFAGYGYWWSATAQNATNRYLLGYNSNSGQFVGTSYYSRYTGHFVRCVRSS